MEESSSLTKEEQKNKKEKENFNKYEGLKKMEENGEGLSDEEKGFIRDYKKAEEESKREEYLSLPKDKQEMLRRERNSNKYEGLKKMEENGEKLSDEEKGFIRDYKKAEEKSKREEYLSLTKEEQKNRKEKEDFNKYEGLKKMEENGEELSDEEKGFIRDYKKAEEKSKREEYLSLPKDEQEMLKRERNSNKYEKSIKKQENKGGELRKEKLRKGKLRKGKKAL